MKRVRIKGRTNKFINKELKNMMKLRDRRLKVFRFSREEDNTQIEMRKSDAKSLWKVISEFVPSKDSQ